MNRQVLKRMATAGAFTALVVRCVVIVSADFYFFPGRPDWKQAFLANHFFIANLHWLVGFSAAATVFVFSRNPFNLPPKKCPTQGDLNDVVKTMIATSGVLIWGFFLLTTQSVVRHGAQIEVAARNGDLPTVVFYSRLYPASLKYHFHSYEDCSFGIGAFVRLFTSREDVKTGRSLLHIAAESGNPELVRYLIDQGLPANDDDCHRTPLQHALRRPGNEETARILREHEAGSRP